jgi:hypothetical protein
MPLRNVVEFELRKVAEFVPVTIHLRGLSRERPLAI